MAGKASAGLIAALLVLTMLLTPSTVTAYPENPGEGVTIDYPVLFVLNNTEVTLWDTYDPYYIEVTNDTMTLASVAGEFSITFWVDGDLEVNATTFRPYTDQTLVAVFTGAGVSGTLVYGGVQPGAVYNAEWDGTDDLITADADGNLSIPITNVVDSTLRLSMVSSPPVFSTSPDIVAQAMLWYYYDAEAYPDDAVITAVTIPYWIHWDPESTDMIGLPRDLGVFPVSLMATNSEGTTYQNWTITIYPQDIGFMTSPDLTVTKFDEYEYEMGYYPEDAVLKCLEKPTWLHFNEHTDTLDGLANKAGSFDVVLRITHGPMVAYQNFTITVNDITEPPTWLDTPSTIDMSHAMFYILLGVGVAFMLLVFYMRRRL